MRFITRHIVKILAVIGFIFILLANLVSIPFWNITHESIKLASFDLKNVYNTFANLYYTLVFVGWGIWILSTIVFILREIFRMGKVKNSVLEFKRRLFSILMVCGIFLVIASLEYNAPFIQADLFPSFKDLMTGYYNLLFISGFMFFLGIFLFGISLFVICFKFVTQKFEIKLKKTKRK